MNNEQVESLDEAISHGLRENEWTYLQEWLSEEASFAFNQGDISGFDMLHDDIYNRIEELIYDVRFYSNDEFPYKVFFFFQSEWQRLTDTQKIQMLEVMEVAYNRLHDPAGQQCREFHLRCGRPKNQPNSRRHNHELPVRWRASAAGKAERHNHSHIHVWQRTCQEGWRNAAL